MDFPIKIEIRDNTTEQLFGSFNVITIPREGETIFNAELHAEELAVVKVRHNIGIGKGQGNPYHYVRVFVLPESEFQQKD